MPHPVDRVVAAAWLRAQYERAAAALQATPGAGSSGRRPGVGADPDHEVWLALIASVRCGCCASGAAAAELLSALYACHGEIAGTVEHAPHHLLGAEVAGRVRLLRLRRLTTLTEQAVEVLSGPVCTGPHADVTQ